MRKLVVHTSNKTENPSGRPEILSRPVNLIPLQNELKKLDENMPILNFQSIYFSILSDEKIKAMSAIEIKKPEDLFSDRMGSTDVHVSCSTCSQKVGLLHACRGHPGHMVISPPIPHPLYIKDVCEFLTSICNNCGGMVLSDRELRSKKYKNLQDVANASKGKVCWRGTNCPRGIPFSLCPNRRTRASSHSNMATRLN